MPKGAFGLGLLLLACGVAVPSPSAGDAAVENGTILIVEAPHHGDPGGSWTVEPDGSGRRLLPKPARSYPVGWSPDGRQLTFLCGIGVCRARADGTRRQVVFRGLEVTAFDWSPEGKRLVVLSRSGRDVIVVPAAGGRSSLLHRIVGLPAYGVRWSPNGLQLALVRNVHASDGTARSRVCVMAAKRTKQLDCQTPARPGWAALSTPSWSADSRSFVFSATTMTPAGVSTSWIHRFEPATRSMSRLRPGRAPQLSPDGSVMAYVREGLTLLDLASGSDRTLVAEAGAGFAWAPRGDAIAYFAAGGVAVVSVTDGMSKLVFREVFNDPYTIAWAVKPVS